MILYGFEMRLTEGNKMRRYVMGAAALVAVANVNAGILGVDWKVDALAGDFVATVDTTTKELRWNDGALWVGKAEGDAAALPGFSFPTGFGGSVEIPAHIESYLVWPGGTSGSQTLALGGMSAWLIFDASSQQWKAPGGVLQMPDALVAAFQANTVVFRLNDQVGDSSVLTGPLQHAPEPQTYALLAGLGLVGLVAYRRITSASR